MNWNGLFKGKEKHSIQRVRTNGLPVVRLVKQDHNTHLHKLTEWSNGSNKNGNQKSTSTINKERGRSLNKEKVELWKGLFM